VQVDARPENRPFTRATTPDDFAHHEAAIQLAAICKTIVTSHWAALEAWSATNAPVAQVVRPRRPLRRKPPLLA
ncbi:MAG: hypothetical protein OXG11_07650, partial [Chloroflexi bacterium]|nr:hypothetical protein [Chloroflexota bacterium]